MEAHTRQSRIPKFGFGFKKLVSGPTSDKSKLSSSSPTVSRSKSMRVHRTQPSLAFKLNQQSVDNEEPSMTTLHPPDRRTKQHSSKSNPNSRSNSPYGYRDVNKGHIHTGVGMADSTSSNDSLLVQVNNVSSDVPSESTGIIRSHARSYSFGSQDKHMVNSRPRSASSRRTTVSSHFSAGNDNKITSQNEKRIVTVAHSKESNAQLEDQTDGKIEPTCNKLINSSKKTSISSHGNGRGKRPFSFHEGSPDLNQLATELSQVEESSVTVRPTLRGIPTQRPPIQQISKRGSSSRLVPPTRRSSNDDFNRPSSAASNYKHPEARNMSRPRSAADVHRVNNSTQRQTSHSSQTSHGSRSSTPSSGRSTPMFKQTEAGIEEEDEERHDTHGDQHPTKETKPTSSNAFRLRRTPLIRTNEKIEDNLSVGLNELEGAVLVDAEDYRRMVQEVKTLKTMLLRLKRELAADGITTPPTTTPPTSMKSSVVRLKQGGGANNTELLNKIQKLTSERDKALQDIEQAKKHQKSQLEQIELLKSNLDTSKKENSSLTNQLTVLEAHREYLLDKLERLHADKHKVEDRLNTLEKSALYERTILEGGGGGPDEEDIGMLAYNDDLDNGLYYDDEDATY